MNRTICPYLGLKEDPTTALSFPSEGNFCHHARPVAQVKGMHQQRYCLTGEHSACPVFQAAQGLPLPPELAAEIPARPTTRRLLATIGIPLFIAGSTALGIFWGAMSSRANQVKGLVDTQGTTPEAWSLLNPQPARPPAALPTSTPTAGPQVVNCPLPAGWEPYTVSPADSIYRLSMVYGVSVEKLQQVNCMGNKTTILPGQIIYVPSFQTGIAIPTPTPIPILPNATPAPANQSSDSNSPAQGIPQNEPPTPVPPTATNPPPAQGIGNPTNPPPTAAPGGQGNGGPSFSPAPKSNPGGNGNPNGKNKGKGKGNGKGKGKGK